ncbi:MAG: hypothetical protein AB7F35_15600 [Acetobacteraceae bacterium]
MVIYRCVGVSALVRLMAADREAATGFPARDELAPDTARSAVADRRMPENTPRAAPIDRRPVFITAPGRTA